MNWWRDRSLTLVLLALFAVSAVGQLLTGRSEYNDGAGVTRAAGGDDGRLPRDRASLGGALRELGE